MGESQGGPSGPDLSAGISINDIPDGGMIGGHVGEQPVLLARKGEEVFAIGASCTHYGGPLAEGLIVGDTVRCPWHHACFSLKTGEAVCAPALNPVAVWDLERDGDRVRVVRERPAADGATPLRHNAGEGIESIIIVGAGAAGNAAAEMLRREGYAGHVIMIGADESVPYDRPNLSKDYLAGNAPEEWIPLRPDEFYAQHRIDLKRGARVESVDASKKIVTLSSGEGLRYDRLLLATGSEPIRLSIPGADLSHVYYLRTLADSRRIIEAAKNAKRAVVIGASFIGLEVAASLRARGLSVDVVAPEKLPLEKVLGGEVGRFIQSKHESEGVVFHLGKTGVGISAKGVTLNDGSSLAADIVVIGVGVRPLVALAEQAGARIDKGIVVDDKLETSLPGVFAAGDIARYPYRPTDSLVRIEHWVVAERQGQAAARNMLGLNEPFTSTPFFWSNHYDAAMTYVGHAEKWDAVEVIGSLEDGDALVAYRDNGKVTAVAAMGRAPASIGIEAAMERGDFHAIDAILEEEKRS
jgi:NADPH-dependent 2,4-dienoyl-CoA reductase/sulfur reductase-like enzyme/nitrite reductase/ring-hydroxylating ferredoxin subunit